MNLGVGPGEQLMLVVVDLDLDQQRPEGRIDGLRGADDLPLEDPARVLGDREARRHARAPSARE